MPLGKKQSQAKYHVWFVVSFLFLFFFPTILFVLVEDLLYLHRPHSNDTIDSITTRYSEKDEYVGIRTTTCCSELYLEDITEKNDSVLAFLINLFS